MTPGTCAHFNGFQHDCCEAGVNYREAFDGVKPGIALRAPCIQFRTLPAHGRGTYIRPGEPTVRKEVDRRGETILPCVMYREPTTDEVAADQAKSETALDRMRVVMPVISAWRNKPPIGKAEIIQCPVCKGRLHLSQAASNGHVHGRCETAGCLAWME